MASVRSVVATVVSVVSAVVRKVAAVVTLHRAIGGNARSACSKVVCLHSAKKSKTAKRRAPRTKK